MKKHITLFLAFLLTVSFCTAFTAHAEGNLSAPGSPGPIWLGAEPRVINVMTVENPKVSSFEDNEYTRWIEKSCNVKLHFELLPGTDTVSKLTTLIAGDQLRTMNINVLCYCMSLTMAKGFADSGALMDLSEYYQRGLAVNCDKANAELPEYNILKSITTLDGKIYAIPRMQIRPADECKYKMWVNRDWLKKLGIKMPETTEEFHDMLVRFKNEDPNGNGKADEIPFAASYNAYGGTAHKFLTNSFVFEGENDMLMLKDGIVTVSYIQPEWFEACDYLKMLHDEGLISDQSFTYDTNELKALLTNGDNVGVITSSSISFLGPGTDPVRLRFIPIDPLTGPNGVRQASYTRSTAQSCWFITPWTKEQDPELAELCFRVGDFQFCEEGYLRGRYGIEGQNWSTAEDFKKAHPDIELLALQPLPDVEGKYVYFNDIYDMEITNLYWYQHTPFYSGLADAAELSPDPDVNGVPFDSDHNAVYNWRAASRSYYALRAGDDVIVPPLVFSEDELEDLGDMQSNIQTYVNEQRSKYILGQPSDITDRERFTENLKNTFSLDMLLETANNAYQRQYAANADTTAV